MDIIEYWLSLAPKELPDPPKPITMTFERFMKLEKEPPHNLYIIWKRRKALYVGISKSGVWSRWFGRRGRLYKLGQSWAAEDTIGEVVIKNMPASLKWKVELRYYGILNNEDLRYNEMRLIGELHPSYNSTYNS
jgi:hypothetical protein